MELKKAVDVFCSVSASDGLDNVRNLLLPSLERLAGDYCTSLHLVDFTGDDSVTLESTEKVSVIVHHNSHQLGFGAAHNFLFDKVKPSGFFLIINSDISCSENLFSELFKTLDDREDVGIVEGRQLPYEHPKGFNPLTGETNWASGACMLVNPVFFKQVDGFDEDFWMYCEDVDLSWRAWLNGYKVVHSPKAVVYHYTGGFFEYREDRFYLEQFWGGVNYLYLTYKYWGNIHLWKATFVLKRQYLPKKFKDAILAEFISRKKNYKRAKGYRGRLLALRDRIGINGFNSYR